MLNFTLPSEFFIPSPEESEQGSADLTEVKEQAVPTGQRYTRRDNLPPEIQSFVCKKGTTEPDRCFKLIYDGEETTAISPIAKEEHIKAKLEALPNVNEVSVVIIPSSPRLAGEGGGCYMLEYFTTIESNEQCLTDGGSQNADDLFSKAEACVELATDALDSYYNFINITFVNTTACDSPARECDLNAIKLEWVFEETDGEDGNCAPVEKDYTGACAREVGAVLPSQRRGPDPPLAQVSTVFWDSPTWRRTPSLRARRASSSRGWSPTT